MAKMRRTYNSKNYPYNWICIPKPENKGTGMYCINYEHIFNNKDFIFNQIVNGNAYSFVISHKYVTEHLQWLWCKKKDEKTGEIKSFQFPAISWADILAAPKITKTKKSGKSK